MGFASEGSIVCEKIVFEADTGFGVRSFTTGFWHATGRAGLGRRDGGTTDSIDRVLSVDELRAALAAEPPLVEDLDVAAQLQPSGIDLRVERLHRFLSPGVLGADLIRESASREDLTADGDGWWELDRGAYVIGYREKVNLPNDVMALSLPRSSLLRSGVAIHSAVWDAGYSGRGEGLLAVMAPHGYRLQRGARVLQLVFHRLAVPASVGYRGRYLGEGSR